MTTTGYIPELAALTPAVAADILDCQKEIRILPAKYDHWRSRENGSRLCCRLPQDLWHNPPLLAADTMTGDLWSLLPAYIPNRPDQPSYQWVRINRRTAKTQATGKHGNQLYYCKDWATTAPQWLTHYTIQDLTAAGLNLDTLPDRITPTQQQPT